MKHNSTASLDTHSFAHRSPRTRFVTPTAIFAGLTLLGAPTAVQAGLFDEENFFEASGVVTGFSFWTTGGSAQILTPSGIFSFSAAVFQPLPEDTIQFEFYLSDPNILPIPAPWETAENTFWDDGFLTGGFPIDGQNPYTQDGNLEASGWTALTLGEWTRVWAINIELGPLTWEWDEAQQVTVSDIPWSYKAVKIFEQNSPHAVADSGNPLLLLGFGFTGLVFLPRLARYVGGV
jgi:hypothetical protein